MSVGERRLKLRPEQQDKIVAMVSKWTKTAADAARLFNVHPATVSRILASVGAGTIRVMTQRIIPHSIKLCLIGERIRLQAFPEG